MDKNMLALLAKGKEKQKELHKKLSYIQKKKPKNLDLFMQETHATVFKTIDCMQCANCCKTTGPLFTAKDIVRLSQALKLKPQQFISKYLYQDEDGDYVLQQLPCPFLAENNACLIYEFRPKACKEFPHTDRKKFYQINALTKENLKICPAVVAIVSQIEEKYF